MSAVRSASGNSRLARLLPGVYYILERTDQWEVKSLTGQSSTLFGYTMEEVISAARSFLEMIIVPEDIEMVQKKKRASTNETTLYELEYRIRTKTGRIKYVVDKYTCYRDEWGVLVMEGYISEMQQITSRNRLFLQLQAYRNAVDVNMISSITDKTGKIIYANENFCKVSKYEMWELVGQNHRIVNSQTHDEHFFAGMWKTISKGNLWHGEIRNRAKDGTLYWVDTVIIPIFDEQNKIVSYLSLRTLIDDRKKAEEQRRNYTSMLESLAFIVAHDVRGPLCTILGLTNVLRNYQLAPGEVKLALEYLNGAAIDLDKVTHRLTKFVNEYEQGLGPGNHGSTQ
jgi:PAS domain S-box-containing protein